MNDVKNTFQPLHKDSGSKVPVDSEETNWADLFSVQRTSFKRVGYCLAQIDE